MVRPTRPHDHQQYYFSTHRRRPRRAAGPINIVVISREEPQQFGGGEPEDDQEIQGPRIRDGHRRQEGDPRNGKAVEGISSAQWYALVLAKFGLLLVLIQIMYPNQTPFQTRPVTMDICVAALCIFGLAAAAAAMLKSKAVKVYKEEEEQQTIGHFFTCRRILDMIVLISGAITLSCLVSVFIPDGVGWNVFVSCASIISVLVVAWRFLLPIFKRTKFGHGELESSMV